MNTETIPLDSRSPYEIATAGRQDERKPSTIALDVMDTEMASEITDLYSRLGLMEAKDDTVYNLATVMDFLKEAVRSGAEIEKHSPGLVDRVLKEDYPKELAAVHASREVGGSHE
ncbi:hypothetical protein A3E49_00140 [Candidatus Saccharibacteria bacterium RIFCSPHIGHO2_12_FULL_49_19]|nr:MAG: hypothetical protein A2708_02495 [Candidatus Saccharibacteria bacterium RIFCSPHIGHO2_01_FULL_49_21]OGL37227.1 MAG: hypothetical protein A3E49_00140 [Candidatus Saccharibacteria bacterium RIFCSPHIGHO2_12_FULL_49_19]OGL37820.1 MAG: hypothetical protein A3B63_00020 [Candidatus Saccharibacteria bacterium RIFCSPLOWO2_01_FULL_49_22]